jgi:hypothetical protein
MYIKIHFLPDREHCVREMWSYLMALHTVKSECKELRFEGEDAFTKQNCFKTAKKILT